MMGQVIARNGLGSASSAFSRARDGLADFGLPGRMDELHAVGLSVERSALGGSHSVAIYPPIDSITNPVPDGFEASIDCGQDTSLYVHIAFCETRCTFCHYPVQQYGTSGRSARGEAAARRYIDALMHEIETWGDRLTKSCTALSSIYIGGGTPLVLDAETLDEILGAIKARFVVLPGAEICIEGSPLTITAPDGLEKLRFLRSTGVSRFSFGVQSFDDSVLKYAARGYDRRVAFRAAAIVQGVFENWNIDLIQGLYQGSPLETWRNLKALARIAPSHVTWYHARFSDRPQGNWYISPERRAGFEGESDLLLGRMMIWQGVTRLGYDRIDGNRFVRDRRFVDPFKAIRTSSSRNLLGLGAGAYSHIAGNPGVDNDWGWVFRNQAGIPEYVGQVLAGQSPIAFVRPINDAELMAASYATGLRRGRIETPEVSAIRGRLPQLADYYDALVARLVKLGVVERWSNEDGVGGLKLSELGRLFEDETLALFFSPDVKQLLASRVETGSRPVARAFPGPGRVPYPAL